MADWKPGDPVPEVTEEAVRERFGDRMRRRREDVDLTQRQAAEKLGVSQPTVAKMEQTGVASEELLRKCWVLYGVPEPYPDAPRDPIRRRAYMASRNAGGFRSGGVAIIGSGKAPGQ